MIKPARMANAGVDSVEVAGSIVQLGAAAWITFNAWRTSKRLAALKEPAKTWGGSDAGSDALFDAAIGQSADQFKAFATLALGIAISLFGPLICP
jgi:hypothetical protein